jgi:hypothetical protein
MFVQLMHRDGRVIQSYPSHGRALAIAVASAREMAKRLSAPHIVLRTNTLGDTNETLYEELDGRVLVDVREVQADGGVFPISHAQEASLPDEADLDRLHTTDVV